MKTVFKKAAAALVTLAILLTALLATGCSTPKVAVSVDGTDYSTGEYLAFLYNSFYKVYINQQLYYYDQQSNGTSAYDVWNETYTYGEGDSAVECKLADFIRYDAKDSIVRQVAVQRLMKDYGITVSDEDLATLQSNLDSMKADTYIAYGFSNDSYARMYRETNFNERTLFYTLYGEGGQKAVPAADIRTYFDTNYLSYKIISFDLADSSGNDLSAEEQAAIATNLESYQKMYADGTAFDDVIKKYKEDTKSESDTETTATDTTNTRTDIDATQSSDTELMTALKEMTFNETKILDYTTGSGTKTKALVLKLDPEADRGTNEDGTAVDYFANQQDAILYQLKNEEFNAEVTAKIATLDVKANDSVVQKCDPYDFRAMFAS